MLWQEECETHVFISHETHFCSESTIRPDCHAALR